MTDEAAIKRLTQIEDFFRGLNDGSIAARWAHVQRHHLESLHRERAFLIVHNRDNEG